MPFDNMLLIFVLAVVVQVNVVFAVLVGVEIAVQKDVPPPPAS